MPGSGRRVAPQGWLPRAFALALVCALEAAAAAEERPAPPPDPVEQSETRSTGLPSALDWTFDFDAGWGNFGFANSFYDNPREDVPENLSDQWFEGYVKPALSGSYTFASSSQVHGKVSWVGQRTYGSVPASLGQDVSSFQVEDLAIGWRSGQSLGTLGKNAIDLTVGRAQYQLGHGFLLWDGAAEGGSRGAYWTNARRAFQFAAIGSFAPGPHKVDAFYLDKDELEENDTGSRLWGVNYELSPRDETTIGVTYLKSFATHEEKRGRDGLNVVNVRAYTAPLPALPGLSFEFEFAAETNEDVLRSHAWTLQGAYEFAKAAWKPTLSYRYAYFQGDDPRTARSEAFDPLFPGFYDWGSWWQGEIAGEYFLANSNLVSNMLRVHVTPGERLGGGLLLLGFTLDEPRAAGPDVTSTDVALEVDAYTDWKVNGNFTISLVAAFADPGKAVQQASGRTRNFAYAMVYVAYSY